jgi:hypothetical protein
VLCAVLCVRWCRLWLVYAAMRPLLIKRRITFVVNPESEQD